MIKKYKKQSILMLVFLSIDVFFYLPLLKQSTTISTVPPIHQTSISYPNEKRGYPAYDTITGDDQQPHYRLFFWIPKTATNFVPYANTGVKTDGSSHGPVEKWLTVETKTTNSNEKLVFIFIPKTFVYLYGNGFENVIHLKYS